MGESVGYIPPEATKPRSGLETLAAACGMPVADFEAAGFPPDLLEKMGPDLAAGLPLLQALPAKEVHINDEYQVPGIAELLGGGGRYWRPLFSADRAGEIQADDDIQTMAQERGLAHMLTERQPLAVLMERLSVGEQTDYKEMSARILEMTVVRSAIENAQVTGNNEIIQRLTAGMDPEALIRQAEQLGLLHAARLDGAIASDADDLRQDNPDPVNRITATMRMMEGRLGKMMSHPQTPIKPDTFLPHRSPVYASALGRYCGAKLASSPGPSVVPVKTV